MLNVCEIKISHLSCMKFSAHKVGDFEHQRSNLMQSALDMQQKVKDAIYDTENLKSCSCIIWGSNGGFSESGFI